MSNEGNVTSSANSHPIDMKQINTNVWQQGLWDGNVTLRDMDFLITYTNFKRGDSYPNVLKLHPHLDSAKDSPLDTTVFENCILGMPTWFYSLKSVLETGLSSHCSYSGTCWVSSEKVLVVIICFGERLCQVLASLSGTTVYLPPAAWVGTNRAVFIPQTFLSSSGSQESSFLCQIFYSSVEDQF